MSEKRNEMYKNLQNTALKVLKMVLKYRNWRIKALIEATTYIYPILFQTRKKPGTRFLPFSKPEKPVLKNRPEMETLVLALEILILFDCVSATTSASKKRGYYTPRPSVISPYMSCYSVKTLRSLFRAESDLESSRGRQGFPPKKCTLRPFFRTMTFNLKKVK